MKLVFVLLSLFSATTYASEASPFSVALGYTAIGSEIGLAASAQTPYFINNKKTALGIQYSILESLFYHTYSMPQFNAIHQIMNHENVSVYFKNGISIIDAKKLTDTGSFGINFSLGGTFDIGSDRVKLQAETGYFLSFARTEKYDDQPFARGAGFSLGLALAL